MSSTDADQHTLTFNFHTITNRQAIDALVYALSIELWIQHGIHSSQSTAECLVFASATHCTLAQLAVGNDPRFSITRW